MNARQLTVLAAVAGIIGLGSAAASATVGVSWAEVMVDGQLLSLDHFSATQSPSNSSLWRVMGDGSVRTCDGSVTPSPVCASGNLAVVGGFSFAADIDQDPFITWAFSYTAAKQVTFSIQVLSPYLAGPYSLLLSEIDAMTGDPLSDFAYTGLLDGVTHGPYSCATAPCATSDAVGSPVSGLFGEFATFKTAAPPATGGLVSGSITGRETLLNNVPEPGTLALLGLGLGCVGWSRRKATPR